MQQQPPPDAEVEGWLKTLGVESLCQWDVLVFLYRHQATLAGADYLARLLGYATEPVVDALDALESLGCVGRSRVSQGARLYRFTVPDGPPHGEAFKRLLALAGHRAGRLLLSGQLRRDDRTPREGFEAARRFPGQAQQVSQAAQQRPHEREERSRTWRKAI